MGQLVTNTTSAVVGLFFMVEGSGMGFEHFELRRIYIGNSQTEIEGMIRRDFKIADGEDLNKWLPQNFAKVRFYNPAEEG